MVKDGFTTYAKKIYDPLNNQLTYYQLQRVTCPNPECKGHHELHVLLPDSFVPKEQYDAKTLDDLVLVQDEYSKYLSRLETRPNIRTKRFFKEFIEACPLIKQIQRRYHSEFNHLFKYYVLGKRGSKVLHSIKKLRVLTVNLLKLLYLQEHQLTNQDYDPKAIPTTNASQIPLPNILNTICCKFVQTPSTLHKISLPYTSSKIALQTEIRPP